MASFYNVAHEIHSQSHNLTASRNFDIISALPVGISASIFRMLDPTAMIAAIRVSWRWYRIYRADRPLRSALKKKVIEQRLRRKELIHNLSVRPTDSWYRRDFNIASPRLRTPDRVCKKRKPATKRHQVQRAKLLRMWIPSITKNHIIIVHTAL